MIRRIIPCLALVLVAGCMEGKKETPLVRTPSLYTRLGGEPAISKVVDVFVVNMISSDKIRPPHKKHFLKEDVPALKRKLVEQIGEATGGPQKYSGRTMKESHKGLDVTDADFDATVAALDKALDENKVGKEEKDQLLKKLESMRTDIVEAKN
jgi:hemoglobin